MATYRQIRESLGIHEGQVKSRKDAKPGDTWQTDSGNWYGMRKDKDTGEDESQSYGHEDNSKDKAQLYAKGGDPSTLDTKDGEEEPKPETPAPKKLNPQELKDKQVDDQLIKDNSKIMNFEERITDLQVRAEWDLEGKEEKKQKEALITSLESLKTADMLPEQKDAVALAQAIGSLYGARVNSGAGIMNLGEVDRDLLTKNKEMLAKGYDEAEPKKVEVFVRAARHISVPETVVRDTFKTLPKKLQDALARKGKVGDSIKGVGGHFNGYKAVDPKTKKEYITSDVNDSNIGGWSDPPDTDKLEVVRGNTGNSARAILVWRMYLEQGGKDGYTGLPLDLESMDLEHVVGYNNKDKGKPTNEDFANREHERNQVLTSSAVNQQKSDQSMQDFSKNNVDSMEDMTTADFKARDDGYDTINESSTVTEKTALRLQGDIEYSIKGSSETTSDPTDPRVEKSEKGVPKVTSATLGREVTAKSLQNEFDIEDQNIKSIKTGLVGENGPITNPDDVKAVKGMKSKLGRKTIQAMGLPRGATDKSGRRTNPIYSSDQGYRDFGLKMAERKYEDRQEMKDTWIDAQKLVSTKEVRDLSKGKDVSQTKVFDLYIRGDVAGIEALGVKLTDDDKKKLEKRGNVMEIFSPKSGLLSTKYESLEGTISRMAQ